MQSSNIPAKFSIIWASGVSPPYVRAIPTTPTSQAGAAALTTGFPATNFAVGGTPPFGEDHNGILQQITAWNQWQAAGGPITYDSSFQSAIGGYPKGAIVQSAVTSGLYFISTAENNTTNPDSGGGGWALETSHIGLIGVSSNTTVTIPAGVYYVYFKGVCGGGGGGGGSYGASSGGSGGSGSPWADGGVAVVPGDTISFVIGVAGSGGASGNPATQGGYGGSTTVSHNGTVVMTVTGGGGGLPGTNGLASSVTAVGAASGGAVTNINNAGTGGLGYVSGTLNISSSGGSGGGGGATQTGVTSTSTAVSGQGNPTYGGGGGGGASGGNGASGASGHAVYWW